MAAALHTTQPVRWSHSPVVDVRASAPSPQDVKHTKRRAALIAALVAAYLLAPDAVQRLARLAYAARVAAYTVNYLAQARAAGAQVADDWQPSDTTLAALAAAAQAAAQSVAQTYRDELTNAATRAVDEWLTKQQPTSETSVTPSGVPRDLADDVKAWADQRAQWKAQQVGQYEAAQAAHQGAQDAAHDITDGTLTDASGDPLDTSQLRVAVLPAESSGDYCSAYAGRVFQFDDAPSLQFPAHQGCIHYTQILAADGSEVDL